MSNRKTGKRSAREELRQGGLDPDQRLAFRNGGIGQLGEEPGDPWACADDKPLRRIGACIGRDHDLLPGARILPTHDTLAEVQLCPVTKCLVDVGQDRALGEEEPTIGLPDGGSVLWETAESGVAALDLARVERGMVEVVELGRFKRAAEDGAVPGSTLEATGGDQESLAAPRLQLVPELVRAPKERDVGRVLVIGQADDPGGAMR